MTAKKAGRKVKTLPRGTRVTWKYRSATGHGSIAGIKKRGTTSATTEYKVRETDHHKGEPKVVNHYGRALRRSRKGR